MIQEFKDRFRGSSIAILGSSPSIELYKRKEDIAIAVNGAAFTEKWYDIFMAGDVNSPNRDWWLATNNNPNKEGIVRIVSSYISPFDHFLFPDEETRAQLQQELRDFREAHKSDEFPYAYHVPALKPQKPHSFFRFGGFGLDFVKNISPEQEVMYWGGTIAAIALQLALISGSKDIHLYGCAFSNSTGTEYCYACPSSQKGEIIDEQIVIMQATIDKLRDLNMKIAIHGGSALH